MEDYTEEIVRQRKLAEEQRGIAENQTENSEEIENERIMKKCHADLLGTLTGKIEIEFDFFIMKMKRLSAEKIICRAYEIVTKEEIKMHSKGFYFELSDEQIMALIRQANTLDFLYKFWCENIAEYNRDKYQAAFEQAAEQLIQTGKKEV